MFELNHPIKIQHVSKAETPHVMIISILTKDNFFLFIYCRDWHFLLQFLEGKYDYS